ncbi:exodeoxyribonuclease VII small subunit [Acidovorax sp. NPDC077693]|uniref:exodeoxyribonuclease VII small subunit n=1 Tax=unclassified Acidovorax TaxID=2684926 RepID=UPI0037C745B2
MSETFRESYRVLQQHAQTLRKQSEPNIDDLLTIVEESVTAYKVCQTRIDAVEQALEKALGNAQTSATDTSVKPAQEKSTSTGAPGDDDIPF